jgi:hypothetical protein
MPPPFFFSGFSATKASVVSSSPATLAAFWSAVRTCGFSISVPREIAELFSSPPLRVQPHVMLQIRAQNQARTGPGQA